MRKPDELALFAAVKAQRAKVERVPVWPDIAQPLGMCEKRTYSILYKWSGLDWWDYGVNARWGWFTDKAPATLQP